MVDEIKLDIKQTIPEAVEAALDQPHKWAAGLVNNAQRIFDRISEVLPDEGTWNSRVAVPANTKFNPMIDAAFVSNAGLNATNIKRAHYKGLADSFDQWVTKLGLMFATVDGVVAKRFVDQVNNSKDSWAAAVRKGTLRATGDRVRGLLLPQVLYWMTGDFRANQMTNNMEIVDGAPYDFLVAGLKSAWKAAMMGKVIQSLILIIKSDFNAAEITTQNHVINQICQEFKAVVVKPFIVPAGPLDSKFSFEYADPTLILHARVVLV